MLHRHIVHLHASSTAVLSIWMGARIHGFLCPASPTRNSTMATPTLFATQLLRHRNLKAIDRDTMYRMHPKGGLPYTPVVHKDPARGPSIFLYAYNNVYKDRILPDGLTIEYHASRNDAVNDDLNRLVGREVTLYAQLGRQECRQGKVLVQKPPAHAGVYHLRLLPPPADTTPVPTLWADMVDDE